MRVSVAVLIGFFLLGKTYAQEEEKSFSGKLSGQWRTFYQSTYNADSLKDFQTLATGGKIKYEHSFFKNKLSVGGAFYMSFNTGIQDLSIADSHTNKVSRYELGMYDVTDPKNNVIIFPGELYVKYSSAGHEVTLGRMKLVSPFINPQDGRMIPTLEQGIWYKYNPQKKYSLQLGVLNAIAPRSTAGFFGIGESIGKYPVGRAVDGSGSQYLGNVDSDYIVMANVEYTPSEKLNIQVWDYYVDNVFHSVYLKPQYTMGKVTLAAEWLHQDRVNNGGNDDDALTYFREAKANVVGAELAWQNEKCRISLGYDHILDGGRFLFPREWGREFLFSFQKRERSEGSSNNHAMVLTHQRIFDLNKENQIKSIVSVGHQWKAKVSEVEDNKYAQPSYTHINLDLFYINKAKLKGLKPELLLTYKAGSGDEFETNANFVINKVDMFQINAIVNYNF